MSGLTKAPESFWERFWVIRVLSTTIGKKFVMALTGLFWCAFLVVHLGGNILLYVGPDAYNKYAHTLHSQEWAIRIAEFGLLALLTLHVALAFQTTRENAVARRKKYRDRQSKITGRMMVIEPENWMGVTGLIILLFLFLHIFDFTLQLRPDIPYSDLKPFDKAIAILKTPISMFGYLIGCIALGVHLVHGFESAFQTLGLNHPRYEKLIHWFGIVFALVMSVGFALFPLWAATK